MNKYSLTHLSDGALLRDLATLVAKDCATTAELLAHIAEVDARKLYRPAAYPSMFAYCVGELHLSEECAFKRIHAARTAGRFPAIFAAVADGSLHLSAVIMLAPHLTEGTAAELLAAAAHKTKPQIERLLAERFPQPDLATRLEPVRTGTAVCTPDHAPVVQLTSGSVNNAQHAPGRVGAPVPPPKLVPRSPQRYALQVTIDESTQAKLRRVQDLLGHHIPSGDLAMVLDHALDLAIRHLETRKFAATGKPRPNGRRSNGSGRYIPAHIRRAVWKRDGGRCTYVSETGTRCPSRNVEFDHVDAVARGGSASVDRVRLLCPAHNQFAAEMMFGIEFMKHKREEARSAVAKKRAAKGSRAEASGCAATEELRSVRRDAPAFGQTSHPAHASFIRSSKS